MFRIARLRGRKILTPKGTELTTASSFAAHIKGTGYHTLLDDIIDRFYPITNLMQTQEVLRDVGVAYAKEMRAQNVMYAEGRIAPQYHTGEGLSVDEVVQSMQEGLAEGCERFGVRVNLIVAIGRESDPKTGEGIARAALRNKAVVALDLGGPEIGNPPEKFEKAFAMATAAGLKKTIHAGEGAGSVEQNLKNIRTAIVALGANRVGHARDIAKDPKLVESAIAKGVTIEMNPQSNKALQYIKSPTELAISELLSKGVLVTVNSDDPALWPHGGMGEVLYSVCRSCHLGLDAVDRLVSNGIEGAFTGEAEKKSLREQYREARRKLA